MALHGSDRSERKRLERRAREREERFNALARQIDRLEERILALPQDDMRTLLRITALTVELRHLDPNAIAAREELVAQVTAIITEAEAEAAGVRHAPRGRQARHAREDIPGIRGGRPRGR